MSAPVALRPPHSRHLIRWLLGILVPLLVVGFLAEDVLERERFAFETPLMEWIHAHAAPWLTGLSLGLHTFGGPWVMTVLAVALPLGLWLRGRHQQALFALLGLGSAVGIAFAMKLIFNRPRPELWTRLVSENGASFPSGHSAMAAALGTALCVLLWRTPYRWPVVALATVYVLLSGVARLVLGLHFPTDVLAGWMTGLACVLGAARLTGLPRPR
ncbi:phosphatase PAP2 family protein [Deinococcus koreensis]|uniref:Phosphoesterase n=1 Tax=Deinococcus koreensis TaxID=2054903 RepID=A0A2K3UWF7_9DEIO|nr:phosphatase PAP2 family protein [Deinococcus koreensis]PNY80851.1 phosphoesterase [Deinococcus koreensis]